MPGANCSILGCATSGKHVGVGIFKTPAETDELSKKTREAWISVYITKDRSEDRSVDESLRRQINSGNLFVCERHFRKEAEYECCIKVYIRDLTILGRQRIPNTNTIDH
jgi:hypothetical protein